MTPLEQLTAWAEEGFSVCLTINDGHQEGIGKASYCLWVSKDDGGYELGDNDVFGSLEEAVAANLAAPWEEWEEPDECCGIGCDTPGEPGHAAVSINEPTIDMNQQAEVLEVNGKPQMTIFDSNGTEYAIKYENKETDA